MIHYLRTLGFWTFVGIAQVLGMILALLFALWHSAADLLHPQPSANPEDSHGRSP